MPMPLLFSPFSKSKPSPPLRIAGVILLQDHEEDRLLHIDSCRRSSHCSKPRRIAAHLFSGFNRGKVTKRILGDENKEHDDVAPPDYVTDGPDLLSEICGSESNFNVGIGCCLLHLIAESTNELKKTMELRIQMKSVLQNAKEELLNKDLLVSENLESKDGDGVQESLGFNSNLLSNRVLFDQSSNCDDALKEEDCLVGMDRLEAELEVELERLQLHLDSGKFSTNPPEETIEFERNENSPVRSTYQPLCLFFDLSRLPLLLVMGERVGWYCKLEMVKAKSNVSDGLTLELVRDSLMRQEVTIVFSLIERARFPLNAPTYDPSYFSIPGSYGSLVEFVVKQTEAIQAKAVRYDNPVEHPFFPDNLPPSQIPRHKYPQALSKRIRYGKLVAEVKFRDERKDYEPAIRARDKKTLMDLLTVADVEEAVKKRVAKKAMTLGQEVKLGGEDIGNKGKYKVDPAIVSSLYGDWVTPLTNDVQVDYLLHRLD